MCALRTRSKPDCALCAFFFTFSESRLDSWAGREVAASKNAIGAMATVLSETRRLNIVQSHRRGSSSQLRGSARAFRHRALERIPREQCALDAGGKSGNAAQ